jgi:gluconolactonase
MQLSVFATALRFPEGPVWMPDGSVLVCEVASGTIQRCYADGSKQLVATTGGGPNGAAIGPDGALYVCNNGAFAFTEVRSRGWLLPAVQPADSRNGSI